MHRLGRAFISVSLIAAMVGGGFFLFRQLVSGPEQTTAPTVKKAPAVQDGVATYPIPEFIGFTTPFISTEVAIDSMINGERLVGTMGSGAAGDWYAQFQQGPTEVAGRDLMNAGSGRPYCSRPTGTAEFICDPTVQRPGFLEPYERMSSISSLVAFVPLTARPFAWATFADEEDLNGVIRSRYDITIDGNQFEIVDPVGFSGWASGFLIDVAGTVHMQLWIDANQIVWKSHVWTDGFSDYWSVTVIRVDQQPLVIPFTKG